MRCCDQRWQKRLKTDISSSGCLMVFIDVCRIRTAVRELYEVGGRSVVFHGWHHVRFVARKSVAFADELGADVPLVEASAYVHDLNYLVGGGTAARDGASMRADILVSAGLKRSTVLTIEEIVLEAETRTRGSNISVEAMALSDADTLFKALPVTPVVLAPLYMQETGVSLRDLAEKIISEQAPLKDRDIYFYSRSAQAKYEHWAEANLLLWRTLLDSLDDEDVDALLRSLPS